MMNRTDYVETARRVIRERAALHEKTVPPDAAEARPELLEDVLRGRAIELWSTASGRFFLVSDEDDARRAIARFGARRGEIYTAAEARRIVAVKDPSVVAEIHDWKRRFDGVVREFRAGDHPK